MRPPFSTRASSLARRKKALRRGPCICEMMNDSTMVMITFHDRAAERKALAFLLGRFSGRVLVNGEHLVPEAALEALADQNIPFTVQGKTTYEQQVAALRGAAPASVQ